MFSQSYAVLWREGDGPVCAGMLVLGSSSLRLETGTGRTRATSMVFRYAELATVASAAPVDRIRSRPTAILERRGRDRLTITPVDGFGSVREIVERLAAELTFRIER